MILHKKQSIGLDIADRSIAVAVVAETENGPTILSRGYVPLPTGVVERGKLADEKRLAAALREVFSAASIDPFEDQPQIVFGLPSSQVFFHIFELAALKSEERENAVRSAALSSIPLPVNDLLYSYAIRERANQQATSLLVAASRAVVTSWRKFFENIGLNVQENFDIESLATRRGLFLEPPVEPVCIVDIGAVTSDIDIFDAQGLYYTYSVLIAGDTLTHEIAKVNKISWEEAEDLKIRVGLTKDNSNILPTLVKTLEPLRDEIKTALQYFRNKTGERISEVILVGGTSQLKGLKDYFSANLELPVRLGEPAVNFVRRSRAKTTKRAGKTLLAEDNQDFFYIEAIGLARRAFGGWWQESDPSIILTPEEDLAAAKNVLEKVERTIKKEETIIVGAIKRLFSRRWWLFSFVVIAIVAVGSGYRYWSPLSGTPPSSKVTNSDITSLVFPENPSENGATNGISETGNPPAPPSGEETPSPNDAPEPATGPQNQDQPAPPADEGPQVLITDTPTGWLNVRSGPGTTYPILTKVYPGKSYPLLQESEKWYKIKADLTTEGWVINQYAVKQ